MEKWPIPIGVLDIDAVGIHRSHSIMRWQFRTIARRRTMKTHAILAASLALALSTSAFAQDKAAPMPAPVPADDQAAPADSPPMASDAQQPVANTKHRTRHHHRASGSNNAHMSAHMDAHMALTGDESRIVAYQGSPHFKNYPAVDPGHVLGDPPVIDHSADRAVVPPTATKVVVPPGH